MQGSFVARGTLRPKTPAARPLSVRQVGRGEEVGRNPVAVSASQTDASKQARQRRLQNSPGEFFVDSKCIDCDTCRWMAPQTFDRIDELSAVVKQPTCQEERLKALQALLSCPTGSIHTEKPPSDILEVHKTLPIPVNEQTLPGVYHNGYHSAKSYGGTSYLIVHPEGNILVDSPSYKEKLARKIDMLGGVRYIFLTHKDDVADHDKWAKRLKCERIIHTLEVLPSLADVEIQLSGDGPWSLGQDFDIIHTPGHTEGSICLLYKPLKVLFSGDHLARDGAGESPLAIFENYNWFSVPEQLNSVKKLLELDFVWVLPGLIAISGKVRPATMYWPFMAILDHDLAFGILKPTKKLEDCHGRRVEFKDVQEKNSALEDLLASKEQVYGKNVQKEELAYA